MKESAFAGFALRRHYIQASQGALFAQRAELRTLEDLARFVLGTEQPPAAAVTAAVLKLVDALLTALQAQKSLR